MSKVDCYPDWQDFFNNSTPLSVLKAACLGRSCLWCHDINGDPQCVIPVGGIKT